jgi:hypothetical protein
VSSKGYVVRLGAYQDEADAMETVNHFLETYQVVHIKIPENILPHFDPSRAQGLTVPRQPEFHLSENMRD